MRRFSGINNLFRRALIALLYAWAYVQYHLSLNYRPTLDWLIELQGGAAFIHIRYYRGVTLRRH